jgi:RimJ/RimL family protein N-acetyltransferase
MSERPTIRDCRAQDAESVLELWRQAGATPSATDNVEAVRRARTRAHVLVAEADGQLIGSIIGSFDGWRGNIYRLAVRPDHRRQGLARALVAEIEKRLADQGVRRITALVEKDHALPVAFWQAVGYSLDQRLVRYFRNVVPPARSIVITSRTIPVNERIHLSEIRPTDKAAYLEHLTEKDIHDRLLEVPYPYTEACVDQWLSIAARSTEEHGQPVNWAIRNETGYLIGGIGFKELAIGKSHRAEVGYWLAKPFWGQGIMSAVVKKACEFALAEWQLTKITAHVFSFNTASARVLGKCGFEQEGFLKRHFRKDGRFLDAYLYALIR